MANNTFPADLTAAQCLASLFKVPFLEKLLQKLEEKEAKGQLGMLSEHQLFPTPETVSFVGLIMLTIIDLHDLSEDYEINQDGRYIRNLNTYDKRYDSAHGALSAYFERHLESKYQSTRSYPLGVDATSIYTKSQEAGWIKIKQAIEEKIAASKAATSAQMPAKEGPFISAEKEVAIRASVNGITNEQDLRNKLIAARIHSENLALVVTRRNESLASKTLDVVNLEGRVKKLVADLEATQSELKAEKERVVAWRDTGNKLEETINKLRAKLGGASNSVSTADRRRNEVEAENKKYIEWNERRAGWLAQIEKDLTRLPIGDTKMVAENTSDFAKRAIDHVLMKLKTAEKAWDFQRARSDALKGHLRESCMEYRALHDQIKSRPIRTVFRVLFGKQPTTGVNNSDT